MSAICPVCDLEFLRRQRTCFMKCCMVAVHEDCAFQYTSPEHCLACKATGDIVKVIDGVWYAPKKGLRKLTRVKDENTGTGKK